LPVIPLAERLDLVRSLRLVDAAFPAMTWDKVEIWRTIRFQVLFKGDDWRRTEKGKKLERELMPVDVEIAYVPRTIATSSTALPRAMQALETLVANRPGKFESRKRSSEVLSRAHRMPLQKILWLLR
jgi:glycerol-3-phosphate cytidylyltransferase